MLSRRSREVLSEEGARKFADPFLLPSNQAFPSTLKEMLDLCVYLYYMNDAYRHATTRVFSHFMTRIEVTGASDNECRKFKNVLENDIGVMDRLYEAGIDWGCYGNSFWRSITPFIRSLIISYKGRVATIPLGRYTEADRVKFIPGKLMYNAPIAPGEKERGDFRFIDIADKNMSKCRFIRIDPREVRLEMDPIGGTSRIIWKINDRIRSAIKNGDRSVVDGCPSEILEAVIAEKDFRFDEDRAFHFKGPSASGVTDNGWGLPPTIASYRTLHQLQVYRMIDEAVGLDYILPLRLFSPNPGAGISAPTDVLLLSEYARKLEQMIRKRRSDPFAMHALPFPVTYQEAGGNKSLVPKDLIEYQTNAMLDAMGYPAELAKGRLAIEAYPPTLRMFENSFRFLYNSCNKFVKWMAREVESSSTMSAGTFHVELSRPSMANDIEERQTIMQLVAGGEISRERAYAYLGIEDPVREIAKRMDEEIAIQKMQTRKQRDAEREMTIGSGEDMAREMFSGDEMQGGGVSVLVNPAAAPPGGGFTPLEIDQQAQQHAVQFLQIPDDGQRAKALMNLRAVNPHLYALVKQKMEEIRAQAASQGRQNPLG